MRVPWIGFTIECNSCHENPDVDDYIDGWWQSDDRQSHLCDDCQPITDGSDDEDDE